MWRKRGFYCIPPLPVFFYLSGLLALIGLLVVVIFLVVAAFKFFRKKGFGSRFIVEFYLINIPILVFVGTFVAMLFIKDAGRWYLLAPIASLFTLILLLLLLAKHTLRRNIFIFLITLLIIFFSLQFMIRQLPVLGEPVLKGKTVFDESGNAILIGPVSFGCGQVSYF